MLKKSCLIEMVTITIVILMLVIASVVHILHGPYPTVWDDANYAVNTFEWMNTIQVSGLVKGIYVGLVKQLPGQYPPMVFVTSIIGGLIGKSLIAMRLSHLVWFIITLFATYRIGKNLGGFYAGVLSVIIVGTIPSVFYWSQAIMGESALFAAVSLSLLLLVEWGDSMDPIRGCFFGAILGLGFLTKQHFGVILLMPICIWLFWIYRNRMLPLSSGFQKSTFLTIVGSAIVVAAPWYFLHYKSFVSYAMQQDFKPHLLGPKVSWETISKQAIILYVVNGASGTVLSLIGLFWGGKSLIKLIKPCNYIEWKSLAPLLLFASALINILASITLRNSNTRSFVPVYLSVGILAAIAISNFISMNKKAGLAASVVVVAIHLLTWAHICFGIEVPFGSKINSIENSWAQPKDIEPLNEAIMFLSTQIDPTQKHEIKLVGATDLFNPPLVQAVLLEKGFSWCVSPLYRWSENDMNKEILQKRIIGTDILMIQRSGGTGTPMLSKYNSIVYDIIDSKVKTYDTKWIKKSKIGNNVIEVYVNTNKRYK